MCTRGAGTLGARLLCRAFLCQRSRNLTILEDVTDVKHYNSLLTYAMGSVDNCIRQIYCIRLGVKLCWSKVLEFSAYVLPFPVGR